MNIVVSPAYGRDYKSKKDVIQAWNEGKDFIIESQLHTGGGTYISKDDLQPGEKVELRYNRMTRLTFSEGA